MKKYINLNFFLKVAFILFLLTLPYLLFDGKYFIGGDDTRLYNIFPYDFLTKTEFFSWYHFSSLGWNTSRQLMLPYLLIWTFFGYIINSKVTLSYLAFSLPLIIGFIYIYKLINELIEKNKNDYSLEILVGSIFYILSPIILTNQLFISLSTVWLIALIPVNSYFYLRYFKTSNFLFVIKSMVFSILLSLSLLSIPWILGYLIPIFLSLVFSSIFFGYKKRSIKNFIKKTSIFVIFLFLSQSFWLVSFINSYISLSTNSFAAKVFSKGFIDTFTPTVLSTATGNIFYPLLNLFHRQIAFDFGWDLHKIFINFYDSTYYCGIFFILILLIGFLNHKTSLLKTEKKNYLLILFAFILSLFLFTVNIGPLKNLFLEFGNIPGFTMFRNFYDKFALGYIILYSLLLSVSLVIFKRRFFKWSSTFSLLLLFIIFLNFYPARKIINAPLWGTNNIYRVINIPDEYVSFTKDIKQFVTINNTILSLPFGSSVYSVIKDVNSNNVFVGSSPLIIFSGINDISGHLSFNFTDEANTIDKLIIEKKYDDLNNILYEHNINYVFLTKNIPNEVKNTWVFDKEMLKSQNEDFINKITNGKIINSRNNNYELYKTKKSNTLISSENLSFQRISPVKYRIYIKNLKLNQKISFLDSFHEGWKIFIEKNPSDKFCKNKNIVNGIIECESASKLFEFKDISYLFRRSIFEKTHVLKYGFANEWTVSKDEIQKYYDKNYIKVNEDGTFNIELILYFTPQIYFYLGSIISGITLLLSITYYIYEKKRNKK